MNQGELKERTKKFALRIIKLARSLPRTDESIIIKRQIIRCGTSVGSNYRAACRARSSAEFVAKLGIVEEEADEAAFWLEVIIEAEIMRKCLIEPLLCEAYEILAIVVSSINTSKKNKSAIRNLKS